MSVASHRYITATDAQSLPAAAATRCNSGAQVALCTQSVPQKVSGDPDRVGARRKESRQLMRGSCPAALERVALGKC